MSEKFAYRERERFRLAIALRQWDVDALFELMPAELLDQWMEYFSRSARK
jgi:hypothetical protein